MYGRLSYGVRQQSACLFIHFLTDSPNRSTSCPFSMMLSSRQEITCHYFPHQPFSSLWFCLSSHVCLCVLIFVSPSSCCFISLLMLQTTNYNDLSISHQQVLFSLLVKVSSLPTVHFDPNSFDPVTAHLNPINVMLQSQGKPNQDPTAALVMCRDIFVCV